MTKQTTFATYYAIQDTDKSQRGRVMREVTTYIGIPVPRSDHGYSTPAHQYIWPTALIGC